MPDSYKQIESRIENALVAISREETPNISRFACEFNVPYKRLLNRFKGRNSRSTRPPAGRLLSDAQESALCRYINTLDELDIHARPSMVENAVNSILKEGHTATNLPPPTTSEKWLKRFFQRHPEYRIRKRRAIDLDRKKAHEPAVIQDWFDHTEIGKWIGVTETGYINDLIAYQWVQHFHRATRKQTRGTYRLLLCDGYRSHLTYEFVRFCEDKKIII